MRSVCVHSLAFFVSRNAYYGHVYGLGRWRGIWLYVLGSCDVLGRHCGALLRCVVLKPIILAELILRIYAAHSVSLAVYMALIYVLRLVLSPVCSVESFCVW